jgi:hypothetical protein
MNNFIQSVLKIQRYKNVITVHENYRIVEILGVSGGCRE